MSLEQLQLIEDCEERESRLSDWERKFISSINQQLERRNTLSKLQDKTLTKIWEEVTKDG